MTFPVHGPLWAASLAVALSLVSAQPADALERRVTVVGLDRGDMLKLRAGPGTGFRVIVGLPEGTTLINRGCDRVGGTPWCEVSLAEVRRLRGYVSGHYLQDE
ncbi:MAG: SH3 domain-containing protein [Pseudomonadota bacterium]